MKQSTALSALLLAGFAGPVLAQSAQDGFFTNGFAEVSQSGGSGDSFTIGRSEATLGYTDAASGFGVEFGVDALITEDDDATGLYGVVTYQSSFGKLSFGVPRPAVDAFLQNVPTVGGLVQLDVGEIGLYKSSFVSTLYLATDEDAPIGLRYDGTFGQTNVGASYQRFADIDVYNVAANYKIGEAVLTGAVEHLTDGDQSETRYFLGAESNFGPVTAGLFYAGNAFVSSGSAVEAYAKYKPMDQLELTATAVSIDAGPSSPSTEIYGLAADYTFDQGIYVRGGVADTLEGSSDTLYNLALGLRF